jgi:hypothetical protein
MSRSPYNIEVNRVRTRISIPSFKCCKRMGRFILIGLSTGTIIVLNENLKEVYTMYGHIKPVVCMNICDDKIVSISEDCEMRVWKTYTCSNDCSVHLYLVQLPIGKPINVYFRDGKGEYIYIIYKHTVYTYDEDQYVSHSNREMGITKKHTYFNNILINCANKGQLEQVYAKNFNVLDCTRLLNFHILAVSVYLPSKTVVPQILCAVKFKKCICKVNPMTRKMTIVKIPQYPSKIKTFEQVIVVECIGGGIFASTDGYVFKFVDKLNSIVGYVCINGILNIILQHSINSYNLELL